MAGPKTDLQVLHDFGNLVSMGNNQDGIHMYKFIKTDRGF